jgi:hypothetical protein
MRKWIRSLIRIRLGLCASLLAALVAAWGLIFYSGTPRYDARFETDILGAERTHFLETTAPLLLTKLQTPDKMLAYARASVTGEKSRDWRRDPLAAEAFERFKKRIEFSLVQNRMLKVTYSSPERKGAENILLAIRSGLKYEYEDAKIDSENTPSSAEVLNKRLKKKDLELYKHQDRLESLKIAEPRTRPARKWTPTALQAEVISLDKLIALTEEQHSELQELINFKLDQKEKKMAQGLKAEGIRRISPTHRQLRVRIGQLRAELAELKYDCADSHPLVQEKEDRIDQLQRTLDQLPGSLFVEESEKYIPNPEYLNLSSEIRKSEAEQIGLRQKKNHYSVRKAILQQMLDDNPNIVSEYTNVLERIKRLEKETDELREKHRKAAAQEEINAKNRARLDVNGSRLLITHRTLASIYGRPFGIALIVVFVAGLFLSMIMAFTDSTVRNVEDVNDLNVPILGSVGEVGWGFRNFRDWILVGSLLVLLMGYAGFLVVREGWKDAKDLVADVSGVKADQSVFEPERTEIKPEKPTETEKQVKDTGETTPAGTETGEEGELPQGAMPADEREPVTKINVKRKKEPEKKEGIFVPDASDE